MRSGLSVGSRATSASCGVAPRSLVERAPAEEVAGRR
jgi:hypothetical protein